MTPNEALALLAERLTTALALLETVAVEGLTEDHKATVELFLEDTRHALRHTR